MDPFSTAAAAVGLIDVCARFVRYVRQVKRECASIRKELEDLDTEVDDLKGLCRALKSVVDTARTSTLPETEETTANSDAWSQVNETLGSCEHVLAHMGRLLEDISGQETHDKDLQRWFARRLDTLGKVHKKRARQDDIQKARSQLASHKSHLQLFCSVIAM